MNSDQLDVYVSALSFKEEALRDKVAVMIDVMRASSTIITAVNNGAKEVIPVSDADSTGQMSQNVSSPEVLLCGERNGKMIEGYDLGNSPGEYSEEVIRGKTIILNTTNGTRALKRASMASEIYIAAFLNMGAIVRKLEELEEPVVLLCAGWRGQLALEDLLCAGNIIYELTGGNLPNDARDGAKVAFGLYEKFGNDIFDTVRQTSHARRLEGIMGSDDLRYCSQVGVTDVLPRLEEGIITDIHGKEE